MAISINNILEKLSFILAYMAILFQVYMKVYDDGRQDTLVLIYCIFTRSKIRSTSIYVIH